MYFWKFIHLFVDRHNKDQKHSICILKGNDRKRVWMFLNFLNSCLIIKETDENFLGKTESDRNEKKEKSEFREM